MARRPALLVDLAGTLDDRATLVASPGANAPALDALRESAIQRSV
jgi:hypothetical protein